MPNRDNKRKEPFVVLVNLNPPVFLYKQRLGSLPRVERRANKERLKMRMKLRMIREQEFPEFCLKQVRISFNNSDQ